MTAPKTPQGEVTDRQQDRTATTEAARVRAPRPAVIADIDLPDLHSRNPLDADVDVIPDARITTRRALADGSA